MTEPYSLLQVRKDGILTAPRWVHHLVKIATHALVAFVLYEGTRFVLTSGDGHALLAAILGGPVLHLLFVAHEHFWPTDPQPLTAWQHWADWINDSALSDVPLAVVLFHQHYQGAAILLAAGIVTAWLACHQDARP
jgi:hypothetical protein